MSTPSAQDDDAALLAKRMKVAVPADGDTEDRLVQLEAMQAKRRKDADLEARYEQLRNQVARQLGDEGARWFLDDEGNKRMAFVVRPEGTTLDVDTAVALYEEGLISREMLDLIAPRKQNLDGIRKALTSPAGSGTRLTPTQVRQLLSFDKKTPYVRFVDPEGSDDT